MERGQWIEPFLDGLRQGLPATEAARRAGVSKQQPYLRRQRDAAFMQRWEAASQEGASRRSAWIEPFLQGIAAGLTQRAAAALAGVHLSEPHRRAARDAGFRERWEHAIEGLAGRHVPCAVCEVMLDEHPRCGRCGILIGTGHHEPRMYGEVCGKCGRELAQPRAA